MKIEPRDIDALILAFESSTWDEMHLSVGDVEIYLSNDPKGSRMHSPDAERSPSTSNEAPLASKNVVVSPPPASTQSGGPIPAHWVAVTAPNLGTFYRAPKPGAPPFIEIGVEVQVDTEICLIEVMKLFTTLKAGVKGTLKQVCVKDAVMVEHGDVLFYIDPA